MHPPHLREPHLAAETETTRIRGTRVPRRTRIRCRFDGSRRDVRKIVSYFPLLSLSLSLSLVFFSFLSLIAKARHLRARDNAHVQRECNGLGMQITIIAVASAHHISLLASDQIKSHVHANALSLCPSRRIALHEAFFKTTFLSPGLATQRFRTRDLIRNLLE